MDQKFLIKFTLVWILNSLIFYIVSVYSPSNFVLGNSTFSMGLAALVSGLLLTIICKLAKAALMKVKVQKKSRWGMFAFYFIVNSVGIWVLSRIAPISGLGISSFKWAFGVGLIATLAQWLLRQVFKSMRLTSK